MPMRCRRLLLNHTVEGSAGHQFSMMDGGPPLTTPPSPAPAETAAQSNPHRRQTAHQRPAGSFLGGFRTPALTTADRPSRAGIRNPSRRTNPLSREGVRVLVCAFSAAAMIG